MQISPALEASIGQVGSGAVPGWFDPVMAGMFSILVACIALASALLTARRSAAAGKEIELLKAELARASADDEARRDFEYEARGRLYRDCEPLVTRLSESCDFAASRIISLSQPRLWGELRATRDTTGFWLLSRSSEVVSLAHSLLEPLAWGRLLGERLTSVDRSIDKRLDEIYALTRSSYRVHLDDRTIAVAPPPLPYDPRVPGWREKRLAEPAEYWWQGTTRGRLDPAIELCINRDLGRAATVEEFEQRYNSLYDQPQLAQAKALGIFCNPLYEFTVEDRPVYWRMLMCQLLLYRRTSRAGAPDAGVPMASPVEFDAEDVDALRAAGGVPDEVLGTSLRVAQTYVSAALDGSR